MRLREGRIGFGEKGFGGGVGDWVVVLVHNGVVGMSLWLRL